MDTIEKINYLNDLDPCIHELIWNLFGKRRIYIRIDDIEAKFYPIFPYSYKWNEWNYICRYIQQRFRGLYFFDKRGIFESLFIIEEELLRKKRYKKC